MRFLDAAAVSAALTPGVAADVLETELHAGLDPEADPPRSVVPAAAGELLVMPSAAGAVGVKLASVAPGNAALGLPRIQGAYVLFDPETLAPVAVLDAAALTTVRTAAVSALALRFLAAPDAARLLVFGTGPQAWAHIQAVREERPIAHVSVVGRDPVKLEAFLGRCRAAGVPASAGSPEAVGEADVVCCCTTAREPLFDGARVAREAAVVAVGSHEPDARELDAQLLHRSWVVVEAPRAALREAGDVVMAVAAGALRPDALVPLAALVRGEAFPPAGRPRVFKSVGMAWEDAALAAAILDRA
jgi:ornithine cyclodeaminase/alanine dehydrogenase-like protein (mu-crystallin family)